MRHSQTHKTDIRPDAIHGITLKQYAAISYYLAGDIDENALLTAVGIDKRSWNEVDRGWRRRMEEDDSFVLITHYSQYYNEADKYLKLDDLLTEK